MHGFMVYAWQGTKANAVREQVKQLTEAMSGSASSAAGATEEERIETARVAQAAQAERWSEKQSDLLEKHEKDQPHPGTTTTTHPHAC
jgi:hypothetical protein